MLTRPAVIALLTLGCAGLPYDDATDDDTPCRYFAPATRSITIPTGDALLTIDELLGELTGATGIAVHMDEATRQHAEMTDVDLGVEVQVPPSEVQTVIESILAFNGFFLMEMSSGEVPMLAVASSARRPFSFRPHKRVPSSEVAHFRRHAALLIDTEVHLPHLDVRQVSTSLRALLTDTNTQMLLPVGDSSLLIGGTGRTVADLVAMLQAVDEAQGRARQRPAGGDEAQAPPPAGR